MQNQIEQNEVCINCGKMVSDEPHKPFENDYGEIEFYCVNCYDELDIDSRIEEEEV